MRLTPRNKSLSLGAAALVGAGALGAALLASAGAPAPAEWVAQDRTVSSVAHGGEGEEALEWVGPPVRPRGGADGVQGDSARADAAPPEEVRPERMLRIGSKRVAGRVIDLDGRAVVGATVHLATDDGSRSTTDAQGAFEIDYGRGGGLFCLAPASGYVALASTRVGSSVEAVVLAAPMGPSFQLDIVDAFTGLALAMAAATVKPSAQTAARAVQIPGLHAVPIGSSSNAAGTLYLAAPPASSDLTCTVSRPGYVSQSVALDSNLAGVLEVSLVPISTVPTLTGRVLNSDGRPVAGAEVTARRKTVRTRADGTFTLPVQLNAEAPPGLYAYHPVFGAAQSLAPQQEGTELSLAPRTPAPSWPIQDGSGATLTSIRVVPAGANGEPDPFAPHWHCVQADTAGHIGLHVAGDGPNDVDRFALAKDGTLLGRVVLNSAADGWKVVPDPQ